ncbi:MAG: MFS transporter [Oscillospiraceae bacterium]|nr:MFS transporter [Oscillospiraceae bacterium]
MKKFKLPFPYIMIIICGCGVYATTSGLINCLGIFYSSFAEAMGTGIGAVSLALTIGKLTGGMCAAFMPHILKNWNYKVIVLVGCIVSMAGISLCGFLNSFPMLVALEVLQAAGFCLLGTAFLSYFIGNWFAEGSGTALGIVMSSSGIFGAVMNPVFSRIMIALGWRKAVIILGLLSLLLCAPAFIYGTSRPESKGLRPYGEKEVSMQEETPVENSSEKLPLDRKLVGIIAIGFLSSVMASMGNHMATYAKSLGFPLETAAFVVSACMVGNMTFKVLIGVLCDKLGAWKGNLVVYATVTMAALVMSFLPTSFIIVLVAAFFFGGVYGACTVAVSELTRYAFRKEDVSKAFSLSLIGNNLGFAVSGTFIGYAYDWTGTYRLGLLFLVGAGIVEMLSLFLLNKKE